MSVMKSLASCIRIAALVPLILCSFDSKAQAFPTHPITIAFQFGAGGAFDVMLRPLVTEVSKILGQTIVFENRPGGNGRVALNVLKTAKPDGYTLAILINGTLIHLPLADPSFNFEVEKDYVPVAFVIDSPQVITANPAAPFKDFQGMVSYAKANPGKLDVAINVGGASQFIAELLRYSAGIDLSLIPYKSSQDGMVDVVDGRVQLAISSSSARVFVDSGKLLAIATTGAKRWQAFPDQPTLMEAGLPISSTVWFALIAAPGTPRPVVETLNRAFNEALNLPSIKKLYATEFHSAIAMSPEQLTAHIHSETKLWEPVIRKAGIKMQ